MSDDERALFDTRINEQDRGGGYVYAAKALSAALGRHGIRVGNYSIERHRREDCGCPR